MFDAKNRAGDNGEYFYRAAREQYPSLNMVFLLDKECNDFVRLKKDGFNVMPFSESGKVFQKATFILAAKDLGRNHPA